MTPQEMKDVLEAYLQGKKIQFRNISKLANWVDALQPLFNFGQFDYRVKPPEIKLVPHWPAITLSNAGNFIISGVLYRSKEHYLEKNPGPTNEKRFQRLATEYPAITIEVSV